MSKKDDSGHGLSGSHGDTNMVWGRQDGKTSTPRHHPALTRRSSTKIIVDTLKNSTPLRGSLVHRKSSRELIPNVGPAAILQGTVAPLDTHSPTPTISSTPLGETGASPAAAAAAQHFSGDFDEILNATGSFGRFQWRILALLQPPFLYMGFTLLSQIWLTLEPDHWCAAPELEELGWTQERIRNLTVPRQLRAGKMEFSRCERYDINFSVIDISAFQPNANTPRTKCRHGWQYDFSLIHPTITSDLDWVCDDDWKPTIAAAMFFVGAIFGTLVFGAFSDRFGRVPGLVATNFTAGVSGALSALSTNLTSFIITRFIFGMAYNLQTTLAIIYLSECVGAEYRGMVVNLPLATSFSLGMAILPWISWGAGDWKITALATSLPMLFALVYIVADVPESSRWLQQTGQLDKMLQNMRKVAKENRKTVTEDTWKQFEAAARRKYEGERSKPAPGLRQLLKHPRLRTRMLVLMFSTAILLFLFDITSRSTDFDVDIYIAHTLLAVSEAPADLLTWLLVDTLGRRWTITGATTLTSGAGLALAALLYVGTAPPAASTIAAVFCRFTTTIAVNVLMTMSMELIPTDVRSRAFSLVQVTGHVGSLCSTLILYLKHVARGLPQLVLGLLALVGALSVSFLPETRNRPLPDTLEEGEQFGRDQRWLECYCGDQKIEDTRDQVEETERQGVKNPALDCSDDMETHL